MISRTIDNGVMSMSAHLGIFKYDLKAWRIGDKWIAPAHSVWWAGGSFSSPDACVRAVEQAIMRHQKTLA